MFSLGLRSFNVTTSGIVYFWFYNIQYALSAVHEGRILLQWVK